MTNALVAVNHATLGGVYLSNNIDFTNLATQPTWTKMATTGLANLLIKRAQFDQFNPYNKIYLQLNNDTCYCWNGTSWTSIMTLAAARTLAGTPGGYMGYIFVDKATAGTVYIPMSQDTVAVVLLKSVDYGANWTVAATLGGLVTAVAYGQAAGQYIILSYGEVYRTFYYSTNGGASWTGSAHWSNSFGGGQIKQDPHRPDHCYYVNSASDYDLTDRSSATATELLNGYTLANTNHETYHWIDKNTAGHQKIVRNVGNEVYIFATTDNWATLVDTTPTQLDSGTAYYGSIHCAIENVNYGLIGRTANTGGGVQIVQAFVGDNPTGITGVSGTNFNTSPYTNAIPGAADCYVADTGIYVGTGAGAAETGVFVYANEEGDITDIPSYPNLGTPMFGDRASFRDLDADTDGLTVPTALSKYHAQDIRADTPQRHNAWPVASGNIQVSNGSKWVETTPAAFGVHSAEYADDDVANPPTQEDITAALGAPYTAGQGGMGLLDDAGAGLREYLCLSDGAYWHYLPLVKARSEYESDALTRYGAVITANAAEENYAVEPSVIIDGGLWKMWYRFDGWAATPGVAYATSPDGLNWTRYASNPVLSNFYCPHVFKVGSTYHLYVVTTNWQRFDHYTSANGTTWTVSATGVLAVGAGGTWDASGLGNMYVWKEGTTDWRMIYEARGASGIWKIGYATSADGNTWSKSGSNPVITEAGSVGGPFVYKNGATYYLWAHRSVSSTLPSDIGRYSSSDLTTWAFDGLKVVRTGADEGAGLAVGQVADPSIVVHNGVMYLYYEGSPDGTAASQTNIKLITGKESLIWA